MSEKLGRSAEGLQLQPELSLKKMANMTDEELQAWYLEYMATVPKDNVMEFSELPMEVTADPDAFEEFVRNKQERMREGREV